MQFALLTIEQLPYVSPEDQHEAYKYLDLRIEVDECHEGRISGALYPDGSYFDPTGSVCGVESSSLHPFATRGGCERIRSIGQRSARR